MGTFLFEHIPKKKNIPKRAHSKKGTLYVDYIPKMSHSVLSTFQFELISKRAHSKSCTVYFDLIPKRAQKKWSTFHFDHTPKKAQSVLSKKSRSKKSTSKKSTFQKGTSYFEQGGLYMMTSSSRPPKDRRTRKNRCSFSPCSMVCILS